MTHIRDEVLRACIDGKLSMQKEIEVMEHIAVCNNCADRFAGMMTEKPMVSPPPDLKSGILEQTVYRKNPVRTIQEIQERKRAKQKELMLYSAKVALAMAASILMVISMSSNFEGRQSQEMPVETVQMEQEKSSGKKNQISGSLQEISGKMGDALTGFLDVFEKPEEEIRKERE